MGKLLSVVILKSIFTYIAAGYGIFAAKHMARCHLATLHLI